MQYMGNKNTLNILMSNWGFITDYTKIVIQLKRSTVVNEYSALINEHSTLLNEYSPLMNVFFNTNVLFHQEDTLKRVF